MGFNGIKVTQYLNEMRKKIDGASSEEVVAYCQYCAKKVDDFPADEEYKEATKTFVGEQIVLIEKELENVHGTLCEVYARITGYYRPIRNWNKGKREEFKTRRTFN